MEKTINQWNAARSQLAEVQRSYESKLLTFISIKRRRKFG